MSPQPSHLPLAGVRVLSLAEQYPGPYATLLLADLGADVIMVERPGTGDPSRRFTGLFAAFNRNKRSVTIDLKSAAGHAEFLRLVDTADVVLEGFRPGVMARLKLDAASLRARQPGLIVTSISSFGQTGPATTGAGHDLSIQAAAGMIDVPVGQEAAMALPMMPLGDIASAMFAAFGIVAALFARERSGAGKGRGAQIDVSMLDSLVSWMTPFLVPPLNGLPTRTLPPQDPGYGIFATADGRQITLSIAGEDAMWATLCGLLKLPAYAALNEVQRSARQAEITPHLRAAIALRQHDELCAQLEAAGLAYGPVVKLNEVLQHPQMLARRMTAQSTSPLGAQAFVRQPLLIDGQAIAAVKPVPGLGQHNAEVLGNVVAVELAGAAD